MRAPRPSQRSVMRISTSSLEEIAAIPNLLAFARAGGAAAFRVNCVQCHGSGAAGGKGYPNLNDDDWLWGGTLEQIHTTLENGSSLRWQIPTRGSRRCRPSALTES